MRGRATSFAGMENPDKASPAPTTTGGRERSGSFDMKQVRVSMVAKLEAQLAVLDPWFEDQSNHECVYEFFKGIIPHFTPDGDTSADQVTAAIDSYLMQFIPAGGLREEEIARFAKYKLFFIEVYQVLDSVCIKHKSPYPHLKEVASNAVIDVATAQFLHAHVSKDFNEAVSAGVMRVAGRIQNYTNQLFDAMFGEGALLNAIPYKPDEADTTVSEGMKKALGQLSAHCLRAYLNGGLDEIVQGWKDNSGYGDDGLARGNPQYADGDWARRDFLTPLFAYKEHQSIESFEAFFNAVIYILQSAEEKRASQVKAQAQPAIDAATTALVEARVALAEAKTKEVDPILTKKKAIAARAIIDAEIATAETKVVEAEAALADAESKAEKRPLGPDDIFPLFESTIKLQLRAYEKELSLSDIRPLLAALEVLFENTTQSACESGGIIASMVERFKGHARQEFERHHLHMTDIDDAAIDAQLTELITARIARVSIFLKLLNEIIAKKEAEKLVESFRQGLSRSPSGSNAAKGAVAALVRQVSSSRLPIPPAAAPAPAVRVTPRAPVRVQKKLTRWQKFKKRWQSLSTKWKVLAGVAIVLEVAAVVALAILFPPSVIVTVPGVSLAVTTTMAIAAGGAVAVAATGTAHIVHVAKTGPKELTALPTPEEAPITPQPAVQLPAVHHNVHDVPAQGAEPAMIGLGGTARASDGTAKTGTVVVPPSAGVAGNSPAGSSASLFAAVPASGRAVVGAASPRLHVDAFPVAKKPGGLKLPAIFGRSRSSSLKSTALPVVGTQLSF